MLRHPDMPSSTFKDMWDTIQAKGQWSGIVKNRAKDGSTYIVDSTIIPIIDLAGEIIEFISIRTDITKIERQKEDLKYYLEHSSKFINEFETAIEENTIFCRINPDGNISMASRQFKSLMGYKTRELIGMDYRKLIKNDTKQHVDEDISSSIKNATDWQGLVEHYTKDGEVVYQESYFIPIVGLNNKVTEVFSFFADISESIELNKEIVQRGVWGSDIDRQLRETQDHIVELDKEIVRRGEWGLGLLFVGASFHVEVHIPLWEVDGDAFAVEAHLHFTGNVPVHIPIIIRTHPGADNEVHG